MAKLTTTLNAIIPPVARLKATINGVVVELTKTQDTTTTYHWTNTGSTFTIKWTNNGTATRGELYYRTFTIEWDDSVWTARPILTVELLKDQWELRTITYDGSMHESDGTIIFTGTSGVNLKYQKFIEVTYTNVIYFTNIGCYFDGITDMGTPSFIQNEYVIQFNGPSIYFPGGIEP